MATVENLPENMAVTTTETPAAADLWCRLPGDILKSIAKRLTDKADAAAASTNHINALDLLRSVCKSWRSSIEKPSSSLLYLLPLTLPFPTVPFRNPNSNRVRHCSLTHSTLYFLSPLSPTLTAGWLLRVQEPPFRNNNGSKTYHPLNPLSKLEPPERAPRAAERAPRAAAFPESLNLLEVGIAEIGRAHCLKVVDEREKKKKQEVEEKFKRRTVAECQATSRKWPCLWRITGLWWLFVLVDCVSTSSAATRNGLLLILPTTGTMTSFTGRGNTLRWTIEGGPWCLMVRT